MTWRPYVWCLMLIIAGAGFLRVHHLSQRGLQFGDESRYYGAPAKVAAHLRWILAQEDRVGSAESAPPPQALREAIADVGGSRQFVSLSKPVFGLASILLFVLVGPAPERLLLMNALLGTLTVLWLFCLARRLGGSISYALMVSLALALSGFHMIWSRGGFAQAMTICFLTAGLACYAESIWGGAARAWRWRLGAALLLGAAVGTHPAALPYIGIVFLTELYRASQEGPLSRVTKSWAGLAAGMLVVPAAAGMCAWALGDALAGSAPEFYLERAPYLQALMHSKEVMTGVKEGVAVDIWWRLRGYLWNPFVYGEGLLVAGLMMAGLIIAARRLWRTGAAQDYFLVAGLLVPPLALLIADVKPYDRNLAPLTPFIALATGLALSRVWAMLPKAGWKWAAVAVFVLLQVSHVAFQFRVRSGYAAAAEWVGRNGGVVLTCRTGKEGPWYTNGVRDVYYVDGVASDGAWELARVPWGDRVTLPSTTPVYAGLVGFGQTCENSDHTWLAAVTWDKPIAHFQNTGEETAKKTAILRRVRPVAERLGWTRMTKRIDAILAEASDLVDFWTVSLYPVEPERLRSHTRVTRGEAS